MITEDSDFGKLVILEKQPVHSVIFVRLPGSSSTEKLARIRELLARDPSPISGAFVVIDARRARIRPLTATDDTQSGN